MGQPTFNQITFRTRNDNGSESAATWRQNQGDDDTWNADGSTKYRIRFQLDEQNVKAWGGKTFNLYYNLAGGGWNPVSSTSPIYYTTSSYYTDGDDCVNRLIGGLGVFLTDNNGMCTGDASATNTGNLNQYFDLEFVLMIDPAQVSNGQTFQLRVYDGTSEINSYVDEPTITINEVAPPTNITVAEGSQSQASDAALVKPIYNVTPAEGTQSQTSDAASLSQMAQSIDAAEGSQAQVSDAALIDEIHLVAPAEASQTQASDAAQIGAIHLVSPAEGSQDQTSDAASLAAIYLVSAAEATQSQTSDLVSLDTGGVSYTPQTGMLDDFNRADESPLDTDNWGNPFAVDQGAWKIVDQQAVPVG